MLNTFIQVRKYILWASQLLGCILCIYFMINAQQYELSTPLFEWLFPALYRKANLFLAKTGTYLLIVPLTIIILSFLIPENYVLRILSAGFGIFTTCGYVVSGIFRNNLTEIYNLRVIKVHIILPLIEKREIFKQEFLRIMEERYLGKPALLDRLKTQLEDNKFTIYDERLQTLKERVSIKGYANEILESTANSFLHVEHKFALDSLSYTVKIALYCAVGFVAIGGFFILLRVLLSTDPAKPLADAGLEATKAGLASVQNMQAGHEIVKTFVESLPKVITDISAAVIKVNDEQTQGVLNKLLNFCNALLVHTTDLEHRVFTIEQIVQSTSIIPANATST